MLDIILAFLKSPSFSVFSNCDTHLVLSLSLFSFLHLWVRYAELTSQIWTASGWVTACGAAEALAHTQSQ